MAKNRLYEVVIVLVPRDEEEEAKVLVDSTRFLASNDRHALVLAARMVPDEYVDRIAEVDIKVRYWQ